MFLRKQLSSLSADEDMKEFMLEKEKQITDLQMANNEQNRRIHKLEEENRLVWKKIYFTLFITSTIYFSII